jgi:hypothetical protein
MSGKDYDPGYRSCCGRIRVGEVDEVTPEYDNEREKNENQQDPYARIPPWGFGRA